MLTDYEKALNAAVSQLVKTHGGPAVERALIEALAKEARAAKQSQARLMILKQWSRLIASGVPSLEVIATLWAAEE